jgi:hypothetical protein
VSTPPSLPLVIPRFSGPIASLSAVSSLLPTPKTPSTISLITHTDPTSLLVGSGPSSNFGVVAPPLPSSHGSDTLQISSAEMDEKLMSEWELDVRKKVAGFWEKLFKEWTVIEEHSERFRAIMDEMIKRQKTKGKRELLNLQSSVNYGAIKASPRCRKGKAHMM